MDKVLNVQRLSILDLLDPGEINKRASIAPPVRMSATLSSWWTGQSPRVSP